MSGIFINYRTGDGERAPELIDEHLVRVFGKKRVFRDRRSIRPGTEFPDFLFQHVQQCTVLLVLIGRRWLDIRDPVTGVRRIDMPNDYVHEEIKTALALRKMVIPVLLDSSLPTAEELPPDIAGLTDRQFLQVREGYAHQDLGVLTDALRQHVPAKKSDRQRGKTNGTPSNPGLDFGSGNTITITRSAVGGSAQYHERADSRARGGDRRRDQ
ncbi:toll/interleukin-1 receptor domain-containing protein [Streptomyces sp. NPDC093250]|uniref:toll/interleukin-1 receptor domain-containing protein n=1 Tax=Streptomyces sp. NPDC093250 TaxID=3366036 RepID=UPI00382128B1